jgi:hypothetical protein
MAYLNQYDVDQADYARQQKNLGMLADGATEFIDARAKALAFKRAQEAEKAKQEKEEKRQRQSDLLKFAEAGIDFNSKDENGNAINNAEEYMKTGESKNLFSKYSEKAKESRNKKIAMEDTDRRYKEFLITGKRNAYQTPEQKKADRMQEYEEKLNKKSEVEKTQKQNPKYILDNLNAESKNKVGSIAAGMQALHQMELASEDGIGPKRFDTKTPVFGSLLSDNPFNEGQRMLDEVVGRLQSGGQMNDLELKTFREMGPRPADDQPTRLRKLQMQKDFLANKLTAFGLKGDQLEGLGFNVKSRYVPKNNKSMPPAGAAPMSVAPISEQPKEVVDAKLKRIEELRAKKAKAP